MTDVIYHLVIILVALACIYRGYRRGVLVQLITLVGIAAGAICCRACMEMCVNMAADALPSLKLSPLMSFSAGNLGCAFVFLVVLALFWALGKVVAPMWSVLPSTILGRIAGAVTSLFTGMVILSICYNLLLVASPSGPLLKYGEQDDGNLCEGVLLLAPTLMGSDSVKDLAHAIQLEKAKAIS